MSSAKRAAERLGARFVAKAPSDGRAPSPSPSYGPPVRPKPCKLGGRERQLHFELIVEIAELKRETDVALRRCRQRAACALTSHAPVVGRGLPFKF
jgi:hypothetical protein